MAAALVLSCNGSAAESHGQLSSLNERLRPFDLQVEVANTGVGTLAYQAPATSCVQVYRVVVDNEPNIMHEPDSTSFLSLGAPPQSKKPRPPEDRPLPAGQVVDMNVYYKGFRAERIGALRESSISAQHAGPSSPTAGCLPQTWDPIEDAMALGWPKLTGRVTAVGERWTGLRVAGKCNRAACVDPKSGGGGADNHHRTCVTQDWQEQLVGVFEHAEERFALIRGTWNDGHGELGPGNSSGIWGIRTTLISIDHGRPVWSRYELQHNFPRPTETKQWSPIHRTWELQSVDTCAGSLVSYGWDGPEGMGTAIEEQLAAQADPDSIRLQHRKRPRDGASTTTPAPAPLPNPKAPEDGEPYIVPKPKAPVDPPTVVINPGPAPAAAPAE